MGALAPDDIPLSRHPAGAQQKSEPRDGIARAHRLPSDGMLVAWALPTHALASPRSERRRSALESLRIVGALLQKQRKHKTRRFGFHGSAGLGRADPRCHTTSERPCASSGAPTVADSRGQTRGPARPSGGARADSNHLRLVKNWTARHYVERRAPSRKRVALHRGEHA